MKSRIFVLTSTITVFAVLGIRIRVAAQDQQEQKAAKPHRYTVIVLSELGGGKGAVGNGINNKGWVVGAANLTGDATQHATLWRDGVITDLGTLRGPNGNSFGGEPGENDRGLIVGFSETSTPDPLGETFCAAPFLLGFNGPTCLGFVWQNGAINPLSPLPGGNNSYANGVNNRGQVVGEAETSTYAPPSTCIAPQQLQIEAVIWGPQQGQIQELPPLPGDLDGNAIGINDKGQVAGCSGTCGNATGMPGCVHAVVWENGLPTDIGGLSSLNVAVAINNRGQVLGASLLTSNTGFHSWLWQKGVDHVTDLGTLPGNPLTIPGGINNKGQVVGHSCDASDINCVAYIWENGVITDLNTLIPRGLSVYLYYAGDINDRGEIVGEAVDPVTGEGPAFLAIPCDEEHGYREGCEDEGESATAVQETSGRPRAVPPESVREKLQQRLGFGRFFTGVTKAK